MVRRQLHSHASVMFECVELNSGAASNNQRNEDREGCATVERASVRIMGVSGLGR